MIWHHFIKMFEKKKEEEKSKVKVVNPIDDHSDQFENYEKYKNRELSWLSFNERVLEEAARKDIPFAERLSFIAIYQSNLDEFFRVRVGTLIDQSLLSDKIRENKTHMNAREIVVSILWTWQLIVMVLDYYLMKRKLFPKLNL